MKYYFAVILLFALTPNENLKAQLLPASPSYQSPKERLQAPVVLPILPETLDFAGERVPLENYDVREGLIREMLVTSYMHSRTMITLLNTKRYFPIIEPILKKYGVPDDFKYLCMAESGLNPNIQSSAAAAGLWQIVASAAKDAGIQVDKDVDMRYNIEKATELACKYLLKAKEKFGSWSLAAASYNIGLTGLATRISKQGIDNYYDMFLPEETMRYVSRVLSFKLLVQNPALYGFHIADADYYKPLDDYHIVEVSKAPINWSKVAQENGTTYRMLRELNHWIRSYEYANPARKTYELKVPDTKFRRSN